MGRNPKSIAREFAFCFLYSNENSFKAQENLKGAIQEFEESCLREDSEFNLDKPNLASQKYAVVLIEGLLQHKDELIEKLTPLIKNKDFSKIQKIDQSILLVGAYEICFEKETPRKVVLSESLNLAHKYGGDGSRSFINAVLDKLK